MLILKGLRTAIGIDAKLCAKDVDGAKSNFDHLRLKNFFDRKVSLYRGFAENLITAKTSDCDHFACLHGECLELDTYDAIVTDPPYNMNEKVLGGIEFDDVNNSGFDSSIAMNIRYLLILADRCLCNGGRLVFFFPTRHDDNLGPSPVLLDDILNKEDLNARLKIKHTIRQAFSATFSRWLVVVEKQDCSCCSVRTT